jgi:glycosyltransferase involved in cell wall biosynthesis
VLTSQGNVDASPGIMIHPRMPDWSWRSAPRLMSSVRTIAPSAVLVMYIGWIYDHHPMMTFAPSLVKRVSPHIHVVTRFENVFDAARPGEVSLCARAIRKAVAQWAGAKGVSWAYGTLLRDSDRVIVLSQGHRRALRTEDPTVDPRITFIPPPPNMRVADDVGPEERSRTRKRLGIGENAPLVAYIGYIYPNKGFDVLLRAFRRVVDSHPTARMLVLGGGLPAVDPGAIPYDEEMRRLSVQLGIDERINWLGPYKSTDPATSAYLRAADVCALPFGATGLQMNNSSFACAAAHELPVVSTAGRDTDEMLVHARNVYLCPPNDDVEFANGIARALSDGDLRRQLQSGVRELAEEWFSWPRAVSRTIDALGARATAGTA